MEPSPFYPSALPPPELLQGGSFIARPLRAADAALDHAAYMASPDVIRDHSGGRWPTEQFTLAEDAAQIAQHEREHAARSSFTFTLLAPDMAQCLGCLYILPLQPFLQHHRAQPIGTPATAMVTFWVRQDRQESDLPDQVARAAHAWQRDAWPFDGHVFRVNQAERRSALALGRAGLRRVAAIDMAAPPHRYDLYQA